MEKLSKQKEAFYKKYGEHTDSDILKEMLYLQIRMAEKIEANRSNTSKLVWWLIAIPLIFAVILLMK